MTSPPSPTTPWHCLAPDAAAERLASDLEQGLSTATAARRLAEWGANELARSKRRHPAAAFVAQFSDFMILVLIAAAIVAGFVGEPQDSVAILLIVLLNGVIGFAQESRAEKAMAALRQLASPTAHVIRDGSRQQIAASGLVPGDLVELEAGNIVPADLRLTEVAALKVDESAVTGESVPVEKALTLQTVPDASLGDRRNLAYRGTVVTYGRGRGIVVATGMATQVGQIATLLTGAATATPLQKRLARFGRQLALAVLAICAIIFAVGLLRGEPPLIMLLTAISLAVAAIPEALPAVVTISLALGAARMASQNALIRRLPAVETLGSVTFICADKTGTLTGNRMQVDALLTGEERQQALATNAVTPWRELAQAMALCNDASVGADGTPSGDPTETALLECAAAAGFVKATLEAQLPRVGEVPFDSERARMSTIHADGDTLLLFAKGAPERILPLCVDRLVESGSVAVDPGSLQEVAEALAAEGLRVLAFALRRVAVAQPPEEPAALERELTFVGLAGLIDLPRSEAADAVAACRSAGIVPVMITGDHPATALAIAGRLGMAGADARVITGQELRKLTPQALDDAVTTVRVYARVDPAQKIRIVQALQDRGEFVAMTGDGVNDAPALRKADIGVAMGQGGTDVAREAAHMTLLDNNFATIVAAVREGRRIFDNVRKFVRYTMTSNAGEIWTIFLAPLLGLPIPLLPIHILWINLVTDGLPGLALAREPAEPDVMRRPPRPPAESLFARGLWQHVLWVGLLMAAVCLLTQAWAFHTGSAHWQSMVFTVLTLSQLGHVLAVRQERASLFDRGNPANRWLTGTLIATFALQMAVLYVPWLNPIFRTQPLAIAELAACLVLSSVVFLAVEMEKALIRRGLLYRSSGVPGSSPSN